MNKGFIKLVRDSKDFDMLVLRRPTAFVLLTLIAQRAKRSKDHPYPELEMGEALIGDYETYGVSREIYRNDKAFLEKFHFATFKPTTKGTIAKLANTNLFDINIEIEAPTNQPTNEHTSHHQATTNKNVKKNKDKNNFKKQESSPGEKTVKPRRRLTFEEANAMQDVFYPAVQKLSDKLRGQK